MSAPDDCIFERLSAESTIATGWKGCTPSTSACPKPAVPSGRYLCLRICAGCCVRGRKTRAKMTFWCPGDAIRSSRATTALTSPVYSRHWGYLPCDSTRCATLSRPDALNRVATTRPCRPYWGILPFRRHSICMFIPASRRRRNAWRRC